MQTLKLFFLTEKGLFSLALWTDMWWPSDFTFVKSLETPPWLFLRKGKPDSFACAMSSGKGTERKHLL